MVNTTFKKRLWDFFRLTPSDYEKILKYQGGVCAISGKPAGKKKLNVDHDHKTGLIRGGLSPMINKGLAFFYDDPKLLRAAAAYLENPPAVKALGKPRFGIIGFAKKKKVMKYGPTDFQLALMKSKGKNGKKRLARKTVSK